MRDWVDDAVAWLQDLAGRLDAAADRLEAAAMAHGGREGSVRQSRPAGGDEAGDGRHSVAGDIAAAILERLEAVESALAELVARDLRKAYYSCEEFGRRVGLSPATVRKYCAQGGLLAEKKKTAAYSAKAEWAIPHAEIERFQREGRLLPKPGKPGP
ncbi:hypothetical protein OJF2_05690 [Aquisphaera giovannonii]|uniref:Helix-turn-helix domain protein n=1 Tax=Aquisphaera giovannonii TaxID=406548 RepID=A0A5B9VWL6_9BACT|nr:hypothetical protein [Aquisphaera giovannonii]QEH32100.1 hypothetical protein OJF2_05690 [Aquisphaera giovannonii]